MYPTITTQKHVVPVLVFSLCWLVGGSGSAEQVVASSEDAQLVVGQGESSSDGLTLTNGNIVAKSGRPGVAFSFATKPGQAKDYAYFVVFNHDFPKTEVETQSTSDGTHANVYHAINALGHACKVEYRITLNPETRETEAESTLLADASYDPTKGKVFLVDMSQSPPKVRQVKVALPSTIPSLDNPDATAKFAKSTLMTLRKTDNVVDAFCRQIDQDR